MPPKPVIQPIIPVQSSQTTEKPPAKKAKKSHSILNSQPADNRPGQNVMTQLVCAVNFLKEYMRSINLKELAILSDTALLSDPVLLEKFKSHNRVLYNKGTDLYSYKHDLCFESKTQLLTEIQRHSLDTGGVSFKSIREASKDGYNLVKELEKDGDILVLRTERGQQIIQVFWNEVKPNEEEGGIPVEEEFQHLWRELKVPEYDADILKALESDGIAATATVRPLKLPVKVDMKKVLADKKRLKPLRTRPITNNHLKDLIDLTKDYIPSNAGPSTSR